MPEGMSQKEFEKKRIESFAKIMGQRQQVQQRLSAIKKKIGVYSGKGGVGKTLIAINVACLLAKKGFKVGLFDADIDCPNLCMQLGIKEKPLALENSIKPVEKFGIKVMSMSLLDEEPETARIWRGPMLSNAINELVSKTEWGELDYLIVDLPPGTSDAPLTVMQLIPMSGFIIVTTPEAVALNDALRSANMVKKLQVPIIGIIENMSGEIFGKGGGKMLAEKLHVPFIASILLQKEIRELMEQGKVPVLQSKAIELLFEPVLKLL